MSFFWFFAGVMVGVALTWPFLRTVDSYREPVVPPEKEGAA